MITYLGLWRRRADSNRRIEVLQTSALDRLATSPLLLLSWCRGGDSNSYSLYGHSALNAACLPIPPPRPNRIGPLSATSVANYYRHGFVMCPHNVHFIDESVFHMGGVPLFAYCLRILKLEKICSHVCFFYRQLLSLRQVHL